jgi:hypothetical protein
MTFTSENIRWMIISALLRLASWAARIGGASWPLHLI